MALQTKISKATVAKKKKVHCGLLDVTTVVVSLTGSC